MLYNFFSIIFFFKRKGHLAREMAKMIFLYVAVSHDYKHLKEAMRKTLQQERFVDDFRKEKIIELRKELTELKNKSNT